MNILILILIVIGIACLLLIRATQRLPADELKNWFSKELSDIAVHLEQDIDRDAKGEYPHQGVTSLSKRGMITYVLFDKDRPRRDIPEKYALSTQDVTQTEGYKNLVTKIRELNLSILMEEINVEGDGAGSFQEPVEHTDNFPRYYTVTIFGW